jgi:integrase
MKRDLSRKFVDTVKIPDPNGEKSNQVDYFDDHVVGLMLRVFSSGKKGWYLRYNAAGRKRFYTLGSTETLSCAEARKKAKEILGQVANGRDPAAERVEQRGAPSFGELAKLYIDKHAKPKKRTWEEDQKMLDHDLLPTWKHLKATEITRTEITSALDVVADRAPVRANRVRALVSKILNFGIGRGILETNPCHAVARPGEEHRRDRVLSGDEIKALWTALDKQHANIRAILKLALLTAQRRGEVLGMRWAEIDLKSAWWTIPAERSKNKMAHRVPLAPQALAILQAINDQEHDPIFVFPGWKDGMSIENLQKPMREIRKDSKIDFRFHDLRRTAATNIASMGVGRDVVGKILNHAEPSVTAVYDRHGYDAEKRAALMKWDRRLGQIVRSEDKVVMLRAV